jgi:undecaprenyl diphosphate synthase
MVTRTVRPTAGTIEESQSRQPPQHVAIIMDGNGRWARRRGLPRIAGHEAGTENIRRITTRAAERGVRYLTLWAFSTENWRRPRDEVNGILRILAEAIDQETQELHQQGARLQHIGSLDGLSVSLADAVRDAIAQTRDNQRIVLTLAFNYGGRAELVRAIRGIVAEGIEPEAIDEETVRRHLYTADMPDPDLIVRTSGEQRTSNFLIWQSAYAEYFFSDVLWPDFGPDELDAAIFEYQRRERRFGALGDGNDASVSGQ